MSRRSRNIRTLPVTNLLGYPSSPDDKQLGAEDRHYFGEPVDKKCFPIYERTSDDSLDSLIADFNNLGNSRSSSSTLSWGEEANSEASKRVRDELERMDRVLAGLEPIPPNYDEAEYKEWMEFFPNLCVCGAPLVSDPLEPLITPPDYEEIIAIDPACDINDNWPESLTVKKEKIIEKVVDKIYGAVCTSLSKKQTSKKVTISNSNEQHRRLLQPKNTLNLTINIDTTPTIDIDNYLRISPLTPTPPKRHLYQRQTSTSSLMSSQISSSKWLKDDCGGDFASLPFLVDNYTKSGRKPCRSSAIPKGILKNSMVVLPPIEINQFRSVSATPRRPSKCSSALSVGGSKRLDTANGFVLKTNATFRRNGSRLVVRKRTGEFAKD